MSEAREVADQLKKEASDILHMFFKIPDGVESKAITRLVDCLVLAAMLEVADAQSEALKYDNRS